MRIHFRLTTALGLAAFFNVSHAQVAILRLACDEDSAKAEVTLNGKVIGDCPLDVQVAPGNIKVQAIKRLDGQLERSFEAEFRVGPGVAKRVQIVLGAPTLNAEGRRRVAMEEEQAWAKASGTRTAGAYRAYLSRFPQGRNAAAAQAALAAMPPRASFPVAIDAALLDQLEASEAFAGTQVSRAFRKSFTSSFTLANGMKVDSMTTNVQATPHAPGYLKVAYQHGTSSSTTFFYALGGMVTVLSVYKAQAGTSVDRLASVDLLSGSLVPARAGAQLRYKYTLRRDGSTIKWVHGGDCVMAEPVAASTVYAGLSGEAWPVKCTIEWAYWADAQAASSASTSTMTSHYLEDYSTFTQLVGMPTDDAVVFPRAGDRIKREDASEMAFSRYEVSFD